MNRAGLIASVIFHQVRESLLSRYDIFLTDAPNRAAPCELRVQRRKVDVVGGGDFLCGESCRETKNPGTHDFHLSVRSIVP